MTNPIGKPSVGQLQHVPFNGSARVAQDYIDLLIARVDTLGEQYVARQLAWAVLELECIQVGG
jgi:hypothetical protein